MIKALLDVVESGNKNIELMVVTEKETRFLSEEELDKLIEAAKEWLSMKGGNEKWFSDGFCGLIYWKFFYFAIRKIYMSKRETAYPSK